LIQYLFILLI